jgi:drug/metabolite transporter (DMT)-like permease
MKFIWNHAFILLVLTVLSWSGNGIIAKGLNDIIPPIGMAFWRWFVAAPLLLIIAWPHLKNDLSKLKGNWIILMFLSAFSIVGYTTLVYQGLLSTTAINLFLINTSRPTIIVLLSILFFRQGITLIQSLGFALAFIGTVIIMLEGVPSHLVTLHFNSGDLWILAATFCWAMYTVFMNKRPKMHPTSFLTIIAFLGVAMLLPFYIWESVYIKPTPFRIETIGSILYLATISSIVAYLCYNRAVEIAGPNKAGQVSYMTPIAGSTLAIFLLGEEFMFYHAIGFPLILSGIYFGSKGK